MSIYPTSVAGTASGSTPTSLLAQTAPAAATLTTHLTGPAAINPSLLSGMGGYLVSCIFVCNRAGAQDTIRISHAVGGAADATSQYLYYDLVIAANTTTVLAVPIAMAATDVIRIRATNGTCTFSSYGYPIS